MRRFAAGYLVLQIPGGLFADRFGGCAMLAALLGAAAALLVAIPFAPDAVRKKKGKHAGRLVQLKPFRRYPSLRPILSNRFQKKNTKRIFLRNTQYISAIFLFSAI